ncbi:hypothetical protein AWZ03_013593 [Drosophila navojoa]|uniref:Corticotropin-releasing factor domain-containing protein n=1 Tax=Drosophila navojoa TaxID=7232 RepID=A0A484AVC0_DRONA|nr:hypothetical protein AWZ03_013593 [Drosophila navojoa]
MCNWRFCLQISLFLVILAWASICIKMSCDQLMKPSENDREAKSATENNMEPDLYPYDLLAGNQEEDRVFDNGYSLRLLHLIYRTVMHSTNDRRRQGEFERRVANAHKFAALAAAAAKDRMAAGLRRISAGDDEMPINMRRTIDAPELAAADDYNLVHITEPCKASKSNGDS